MCKRLKMMRKRYTTVIVLTPYQDKSFQIVSNCHSNVLSVYPSFPILQFFRHTLRFGAEELVYFQNQYRLSRQDPDRVLQCRRYKEEQRKAATSLLILLIVARAVAVTFQSSMDVDMAHLRATRNGVYSSLFRAKASGGHSKAGETRDAQFMLKFVGFALISVTPARPGVCKCPPPQLPVSQSPF